MNNIILATGGISMIIKKGTFEHQMPTQNPFVISMYHLDYFPEGNHQLGPKIMDDKDAKWRMYYGKNVPGFPAHPHRGFETVTVVTKGVVDHTDGLGSRGRYANGDVQWMTAGKGLQHCEMFPLINDDENNTLELFQVWLSLDQANRMVEPDYKMLWKEDIPVIRKGEKGKEIRIILIAGELDHVKAVRPTEDSWANDPKNKLSIQLIELDPGTRYDIPKVSETLNRAIYQYSGGKLDVADDTLDNREYMFLSAEDATNVSNNSREVAKLLLLESEPINEPILPYGPFVMTTKEEIQQAYDDYKATEFGGWPFDEKEVVHEKNQDRFAEYPDGTIDKPNEKYNS